MFSVGDGKKSVCLICGFCVSVVKKYNLEYHYTSNHADIDIAPRICRSKNECIKQPEGFLHEAE